MYIFTQILILRIKIYDFDKMFLKFISDRKSVV